ncbi:glycosyltransferase [Thermodesulforhabdus norvegica]|uniref:Glycosyl transferase 4-like domain-containing protein n=1 Tax=Thermodesulforhabdus norvegica TaxID=39841 RepID=A0A1I4SJV7_9BACT|nr:glycosyltransferase [Thermodesulforhabdus norvegica]SFM64661.1 Glycosyl transferase 4-like domain-containing protein [Thermodesulforhabdus norvegica]
MKVLMVTHGFPHRELGGAEIYSYDLARTLISEGLEVTVFSRTVDLASRDYTVFEEYVDGISVIRVVNNFNDLYTFFNGFINRQIAGVFSRILEERRPDLVHFQHLFSLSGNLPYIARYKGIPSVLTLHDYWYICPKVNLFRPDYTVCPGPEDGFACADCNSQPGSTAAEAVALASFFDRHPLLKQYARRFVPGRIKNIIKKVVYRAGTSNQVTEVRPSVVDPVRVMEFFFRLEYLKSQLAHCACLISPSQYLKKRYETLGYGNIKYLPLGIQKVAPGPDRIEGDEVVVGFVGNITATKGFSLLIDELNRLNDLDGIRIEIHGQIYDTLFYERCIASLKDSFRKKLVYKGRFDRNPDSLAGVYHGLDAVVFPSLCEENAPLVVREAISAGTPVIASNRGGTPEVVRHGLNGLLFDPALPGDLAEKIRMFCNDRDLRKSLMKGARDTHVVDIKEHAKSLMELYEQVMGSEGRNGSRFPGQ